MNMKKNTIIAILTVALVTIAFNKNKILGLILFLLLVAFLLKKNISNIYALKAMKKYTGGNTREALKLYEKAYSSKNASPSIKINYAYLLLREGRAEEALEILNLLLKSPLNEKDKINATLNLSIAFWEKGDLEKAISLLEDLYDNNYKTTILYQNLGLFYVLNGNLEKALQFNLEAYEYNNTDTSILDNLGLNYYMLKDYDKALEIYEKIMPLAPTFATAYYYYGLTLKAKGRFAEALEMFEKALTCPFSLLTPIKKEEVLKEIQEIKQE